MYIGTATNREEIRPAAGRQEAGQVQERSSEAEKERGRTLEETSINTAGAELPRGGTNTSNPAAADGGIRESVGSEQGESVLYGLGDRSNYGRDSSPSRGVRAGIFKVTAYANSVEDTGKRPSDPGYGITASGRPTVEGRTIAADWDVLPPGTRVYIEGIGYRVVEDRGGAIVGQKIDLYIDADKETLDTWGVKYLTVYVVGKEG